MATKRMPIAQFVRELEAAFNRGDGVRRIFWRTRLALCG